jgi:hypothetical protein
MEDIERQGLSREEAAGVLEVSHSATIYQMELYTQYTKLYTQYTKVLAEIVLVDEIATMFPQCICFFRASDDLVTEDQKKLCGSIQQLQYPTWTTKSSNILSLLIK